MCNILCCFKYDKKTNYTIKHALSEFHSSLLVSFSNFASSQCSCFDPHPQCFLNSLIWNHHRKCFDLDSFFSSLLLFFFFFTVKPTQTTPVHRLEQFVLVCLRALHKRKQVQSSSFGRCVPVRDDLRGNGTVSDSL